MPPFACDVCAARTNSFRGGLCQTCMVFKDMVRRYGREAVLDNLRTNVSVSWRPFLNQFEAYLSSTQLLEVPECFVGCNFEDTR